MARQLVEKYGSEGPATLEERTTLPGVGRKTANVVMSCAFGADAIAVDTHVFRVSNRLGLAKGDTPLAVEAGLCKVVPKTDWSKAHHWLIYHGRRVCSSQKPKCETCALRGFCDYAKKPTPKKKK